LILASAVDTGVDIAPNMIRAQTAVEEKGGARRKSSKWSFPVFFVAQYMFYTYTNLS
jgi:hypothetical protein